VTLQDESLMTITSTCILVVSGYWVNGEFKICVWEESITPTELCLGHKLWPLKFCCDLVTGPQNFWWPMTWLTARWLVSNCRV